MRWRIRSPAPCRLNDRFEISPGISYLSSVSKVKQQSRQTPVVRRGERPLDLTFPGTDSHDTQLFRVVQHVEHHHGSRRAKRIPYAGLSVPMRVNRHYPIDATMAHSDAVRVRSTVGHAAGTAAAREQMCFARPSKLARTNHACTLETLLYDVYDAFKSEFSVNAVSYISTMA